MSKIQENYTVPGMLENIKSALATAGFADGPLLWSDLVPFDQFHVRGLEASAEMAASLHLQAARGFWMSVVASGAQPATSLQSTPPR